MSNYFEQQLQVEEEAMPLIIDWLSKAYNFSLIQDVRKDKHYQENDVDLIMQDKDGIFGTFSVEIKVRAKLYPDIIVETRSNVERNTVGNLFKSQALFLVYVFLIDHKLHPNRYVIHLPKFREWFIKNKGRYKSNFAPNPPENPVYHTEFYPIPIFDMPQEIFLFLK